MFVSDKPRPIDFYKDDNTTTARDNMIIDVPTNTPGRDLHPHHNHHHHHLQPQQILLGESSGEDHEVKAPKKRAETWVQDETRSLIMFRRGMDGLFNTSKSNSTSGSRSPPRCGRKASIGLRPCAPTSGGIC
ncbi:hypothetical protein HID58_007902 [Brassica napus]|uniref:Uncharacterized protein n=1 Tax=Brassica napus TaxID=3708 RepID=A0ABQ7XI75_BRANA|nr:hypothetical protein HID58_007902 [Brassica napus]